MYLVVANYFINIKKSNMFRFIKKSLKNNNNNLPILKLLINDGMDN